MESLCLWIVLAPSLTCCVTSSMSDDAGTTGRPDSSDDMFCVSGADLDVPVPHPPPESEAVLGVVTLAAVPTDTGFAVLVFQNWASDVRVAGGVRRLLIFDEDATLRSDIEISREAVAYSATADLAAVQGELWIAGLNRSVEGDVELWTTRVNGLDGSLIDERTLWIESDRGRDIDGLALLADGAEADVFLVRAGELVRHRLSRAALSPPEAVGPRYAPNSRISGARSGDVSCIVVRERMSGALHVVTLVAGSPAVEETLVGRSSSFNPPPHIVEGRCTVPYYVPDESRPTAGSVHISPELGVFSGWEGTAPVGLAFDSGMETLFIATHDPSWPGHVSLFSVGLSSGACLVPDPIMRFPRAGAGGSPLGAMLGAGSGMSYFLLFAGLTGQGELALGRVVD